MFMVGFEVAENYSDCVIDSHIGVTVKMLQLQAADAE